MSIKVDERELLVLIEAVISKYNIKPREKWLIITDIDLELKQNAVWDVEEESVQVIEEKQ